MHGNTSAEFIVEEITLFIQDRFQVSDISRISENTELFRGGIVDSMGVLILIKFLETNFGIQIEPHEMLLKNFSPIAAMRDFVMLKKS